MEIEYSYWRRGDIKRMARRLGVYPQHLSSILRGKRAVSKGKAKMFERISGIPFEAWLFNDTTDHPAFTNKNSGVR